MRRRVAHLRNRLPALMLRDPRRERPLDGFDPARRRLRRRSGDGADGASRRARARHRRRRAQRPRGNRPRGPDRFCPSSIGRAVPEELVAERRQFDIVLSLEVVEHVADTDRFLAATGSLVAPGGLLVIGTLNRTLVSFVKAIIGAEYVLGWLPRGTHDWRRFMRPDEIAGTLAPLGFSVIETCGLELAPITMRWHTDPLVQHQLSPDPQAGAASRRRHETRRRECLVCLKANRESAEIGTSMLSSRPIKRISCQIPIYLESRAPEQSNFECRRGGSFLPKPDIRLERRVREGPRRRHRPQHRLGVSLKLDR